MVKHAIRNGLVINESDALVPITSREVQCNFSVYESLRVLNGHAVHLGDHIARLIQSAEQIGLDFDVPDFKAWIDELSAADNLEDATMRILVLGGEKSEIFITWQPLLTYPDSYYTEGIAAITYEGERFLPTCKTSNLLLSYLALNEAHRQNAFEALLVDRRGKVLEGTRSNFYAIFEGRLCTALDEEVLSGVTRKCVLKAAGKFGLEVVYEAPGIGELQYADALFISATSMAAMPITTLNGQKVKCDIDTVLKIRDYVRAHELDD